MSISIQDEPNLMRHYLVSQSEIEAKSFLLLRSLFRKRRRRKGEDVPSLHFSHFLRMKCGR